MNTREYNAFVSEVATKLLDHAIDTADRKECRTAHAYYAHVMAHTQDFTRRVEDACEAECPIDEAPLGVD